MSTSLIVKPNPTRWVVFLAMRETGHCWHKPVNQYEICGIGQALYTSLALGVSLKP